MIFISATSVKLRRVGLKGINFESVFINIEIVKEVVKKDANPSKTSEVHSRMMKYNL